MNRNPAGLDKIENASQAAVTFLANLKHAMRLLTEKDKHAGQRDEERLVAVIKWRVYEYGLRIRRVHTTLEASRVFERPDRSFFSVVRMTNLTAASARRASPGVTPNDEAISEALAF